MKRGAEGAGELGRQGGQGGQGDGDAAPTRHSTNRRDRIVRKGSQSGGSDRRDVEDAANVFSFLECCA